MYKRGPERKTKGITNNARSVGNERKQLSGFRFPPAFAGVPGMTIYFLANLGFGTLAVSLSWRGFHGLTATK